MSGDSAPGTFTLHDAAHSRRVAERIVELAGEKLISQMGPYDLGLLLLAAYLHDIGMTPPVSHRDAILSYLLSGEPEELTQGEVNSLQAWLDDDAHGLTPPLAEHSPSLPLLREGQYLTAQYVRFRHNDWSEEWVREHLASLDESTYAGCLADLILLCKSHHYGIEHLRSDDFDPRFVGSPATVLHLRFDACLLRVADVLDFDPERTPKILYSHRGISESSAIFWHKDHELSFIQSGSRISIHARPSHALIHHAIERTIEDVDRELQLCRRLAEETQFHRMDGRTEDLPHHWRIDVNVQASVKPRNDQYVYMDGTFRPDHERILDLLGGLALYNSPLAAIRELLQNAFDAVREQIAYQRLDDENPAAQSTYERIAATYSVSLEVIRTAEGIRIRCRDTGVGMSKDGITSHFLVSGSTASHETKALERTCESKGFSVGRTARFGIGVLAYFLLADQLTVRTRRSIAAGDPDGVGWTFVSHGLTDFGEMRRDKSCPQGTTIELDIREDAMPLGAEVFAEDLRDYIERVVRKVPCHFSFTALDEQIQPFVSAPGWPERDLEVREEFLASMADRYSAERTDIDLLSSERRLGIEQRKRRWEKVRESAGQALRTAVMEGNLPQRLGTFRMSCAYFEVADVTLLSYMDVSVDPLGNYTIAPIHDGHTVYPGQNLVSSWNGMRVEAKGRQYEDYQLPVGSQRPGIVIEIDWTDNAAGEIAVHRNNLRLSDDALEALDEVQEAAREFQESLLDEAPDSPFGLINARTAGIEARLGEQMLWPETGHWRSSARADSPEINLIPLDTPAISLQVRMGRLTQKLSWRGKKALQIPPLSFAGEPGFESASWHQSQFAPQCVGVIREREALRPVPVWTDMEAALQPSPHELLTAEFPPEWINLIGVEEDIEEDEGFRVWNAQHPVLRCVDWESWRWVEYALDEVPDPLAHSEILLKSPSLAAAWILWCIYHDENEVWMGLIDREPEFLPAVWSKIKGLDEGVGIYDWYEAFGGGVLRCITPWDWEEGEDGYAGEELEETFEHPGDEWWLTATP